MSCQISFETFHSPHMHMIGRLGLISHDKSEENLITINFNFKRLRNSKPIKQRATTEAMFKHADLSSHAMQPALGGVDSKVCDKYKATTQAQRQQLILKYVNIKNAYYF